MAAAREAVANNSVYAPIDHAHLARYTLGERALELEILDLFIDEAPRTLSRLKSLASVAPCDAKSWVHGCHTLKGSARAVGANEVAIAAEIGERDTDLTTERLEKHLAAMTATLAVVATYIAEWRLEA
jgi:HPt (histidine-containing phosphotransfer) domain-containing protein